MPNNISYTLQSKLCTGCGVCVGACPQHAITMDVVSGQFRPKIDARKCMNHKGCHRCMDACPGVGCNLLQLSRDLLSDASAEDALCGRYTQCFVGHSTDEDLRFHSASGGMLSQMLIWLLETKRIDGAYVTAFDNDNPLMVKSFIARTREDVIKARGSKYAPVSLDNAANEIKEAEGNKYIIVGVPCHIQGFRKLARIDKKFRDKVIAYFGLYCSCGRSFYLTEHVMKERNIDRAKLTYFAYRDEGCLGSMVAKQRCAISDTNSIAESALYKNIVYKERFQQYYHPLRSFFIPKRCLFCIDHYAQLSDMSFGDIHIKPYSDDKIGINSIIARTPAMVSWLEDAKMDGVITLDTLDVNVLNKSQTMAQRKKHRVGSYICIANFFGNKVPEYDINMPINTLPKYSIEYIQTRLQQFIGSHKCLWPLIKILKSKAPKE